LSLRDERSFRLLAGWLTSLIRGLFRSCVFSGYVAASARAVTTCPVIQKVWGNSSGSCWGGGIPRKTTENEKLS